MDLVSIVRALRKFWDPVFYVASPAYTEKSSGVRCLYLLCHHLNRLGYPAYITDRGAPRDLLTPLIGATFMEARRRAGVRDIVVYPEVQAGNPLGGKRVVRYLLNKPGWFTGVGMEGYGPRDYFIHFADEFLPVGLKSQRLMLPLVDETIYGQPGPQHGRRGFLIYCHRRKLDLSQIPTWVSPYQIISMENPRSHRELAALYQNSLALIIGERTAASNEAILCGCPVIAIPGDSYDPSPTIRRFGGNGFVVGWDQAELRRAEDTVPLAIQAYYRLFRRLDFEIHQFVRLAIQHFQSVS